MTVLYRLLRVGSLCLCGMTATSCASAPGSVYAPFSAVASQPVEIDKEKIAAVILLRTTILALDQALRTNEFEVFRRLGSPEFQAANSKEKLAQIFASIPDQRIDLLLAAAVDPDIRETAFERQDQLRITGVWRTQPIQIEFDTTFKIINGSWKLLAIHIRPNSARPS